MNKLMLVVLFAFIPAAHAEILITQVHYDPAGSDTGKEFIELYNPMDHAVPLDSYSIETGDGAQPAKWKHEWQGIGEIISSRSFFIIGENESFADHHKNLDLQNGPDGVRLLKDGTVIETIGWGSHTYPEYYSGTPTALTKNGESLQRNHIWEGASRTFSVTGNNSRDFYYAAPIIRNFGMTLIQLTVLDNPSGIENLTIEDDDPSPGIQLIPMPGAIREVQLSVDISSPVGLSDITATATFNDVTIDLAPVGQLGLARGAFAGAIPLHYSTLPGTYDLTISITSPDWEEALTEPIEIMGIMGLALDTGIIAFDAAVKGETITITGDSDMSTPDLPTIKNIGNTGIDLELSGQNLVSGTSMLAITGMRYAIAGLTGAVSESPSLIPVNLAAGEYLAVGFSFDVPAETLSGTYTGHILISAVGR